MHLKRALLLLVFIANIFHGVDSRLEFTNIQCTSHDERFMVFSHCFLKSVNRTYKYASVRAHFFKLPVDGVQGNIALWKRLNGFKPFLYNVTFDACKTLANPGRNPLIKFLRGLYVPYSNINHTCPYADDVIVEKVPISFLDNQLTNVLPFPEGNYGFFSRWFIHGIRRADVNVYVTIG